MGIGIGSVAIGIYLGTMYGMVQKYFRVQKFFREHDIETNPNTQQSSSLNLNDEL